jgi:hypothetical protein
LYPEGITSTAYNGGFGQRLKRVKSETFSELASDEGGTEKKIAATDLTLEEAVQVFGLAYSTVIDEWMLKHHWGIEELPETMNFEQTRCISETFPWSYWITLILLCQGHSSTTIPRTLIDRVRQFAGRLSTIS